jgi:hypothetical protein
MTPEGILKAAISAIWSPCPGWEQQEACHDKGREGEGAQMSRWTCFLGEDEGTPIQIPMVFLWCFSIE